MDKKQVINEVKTYLASHSDECWYNIIHHANSIEIVKDSYHQFLTACTDWYKKNKKLIYTVFNARFDEIEDYTFCVVTLNNRTQYGMAKRYKDDLCVPTVGRVAAFARATGQDLERMIGLK